MTWKSIDVVCQSDNCDHCWGEVVDKADQDAEFRCPKCSGPAKRGIRTINALKASFPDGHYRMDGMGRALRQDKLEHAVADAKEAGDFQAVEEYSKEWVHKREEK